MTPQFVIERNPSIVLQFLDRIRSEADSQRDALGFLPVKAYVEQILARKIILLLASADGDLSYAGHLMFGGLFPRLRIYQIAVAQPFRCHGGGCQLIRALMSQAEREGYLSISAYVAEDLVAANRFYERNGFVALRSRPGGATRDRKIIVRAREVESQSLLTLMSAKETIQLGSVQRGANSALYAIDLNVLFDLTKDRPRTRNADALFKAALGHEIRLVVTTELPSELIKSSARGDSDPLLSFAPLSAIIERILFPNRDATKQLSTQNLSDIAQLAYATIGGAAGFITSDKAILKSREALLSQVHLDVIA